MDVRLYPARLSGTATAIPSKSAAHRALLCAAMCDGPTELTGLPSRMDASHVGADILATVGCIEALGGAVLPGDAAWRVRPCRPLGGVTLDCGESGSTLRFLLPVAAALTDRFTITGRGRLPERPLGALRAALQHGCDRAGVRFCCPALAYCTDNAAMVGAAGFYRLRRAGSDDWSLNAVPNLAIAR